MKILFPVVLFVLALPVLAQSHADLELDLYVPDRMPAATPIELYGRLINHGPDGAENVVVTVSGGELDGVTCNGGRCTIDYVPSGAEVDLRARIPRDLTAGTLPVVLTVTSDTPDPNPRNNRFARDVEIVLAPKMRLFLYGGIADPGGPVEYEAYLANESGVPAVDATFSFELPEGWSFERSLSDDLQCGQNGRTVRCTVPRVEPRSAGRHRFVLRASPSLEGSPYFAGSVTLTTANGLFNEDAVQATFITTVYRHLTVTHMGDDGEGSLRSLMTRANAECIEYRAPCKIVFASSGTIRPVTPLPAVKTALAIDGPDDAKVEINGSLLAAGNGLELDGSSVQLRDLVINGFPGNGVVMASTGWSRLIERCFIGTDVTGRHAVPNRGRGIVVDVPGDYRAANLTIRDSVISGNGRSGIFIAGGFEVSLTGNRIGTTAGDVPEPLGNGASGVYLGPRTSAISFLGNVIAFNAEAGIATSGGGYFSIRGNSIFSNGTIGIDHGLDHVTPNPPREQIYVDIPPYPVITAATYDAAANVTRIEGRMDLAYEPYASTVELFASSEPGRNAELFLGRAAPSGFKFQFNYPGDLRGLFITATFTRPNPYYPEIHYFRTSEISDSLKVEGDAAGPIDRATIVPRGADLALNLFASSLASGMRTQVYTGVASFGPEAARDVVVEITSEDAEILPSASENRCDPIERGVRCAFHEPASFYFDIIAPLGAETVTIRGRVRSATTDPNPTNDEIVRTLQVQTEPAFNLEIDSPGLVDPGAQARYLVRIRNQSAVTAREVTVHVPVPEGWSLAPSSDERWTCAQVSREVVCSTATLEPLSADSFSYTLRAPSFDHGLREMTSAFITSEAGHANYTTAGASYEVYRVLRVTTEADDGAGSLRDAIERVSLECTEPWRGCKIAFAENVVSIKPTRPLPAIDAYGIVIDTRTAPVELNGSQTPNGSGLVVSSRGFSAIRGLIVNGFPEHGIVLRVAETEYRRSHLVADNFIGTDRTGRLAVPNGGRGIVVDTPSNHWSNIQIVSNVIGGNARAGVFVASGEVLRITGNRIGVAAGDDRAPLPNGASGIFLGSITGTIVEGNEIAFNGHAGIAVDRSATWNRIRGNATYDNGGLGVDHGIDMVTPNDDPSRPAELPRFPELLTATWDDSAKVTRITGIAEGFPFGGEVDVFANAAPDGSGYGEAQRYVGTLELPASKEPVSFVFETREDLRGLFVTATLTRRGSDTVRQGWTSEIGRAVGVK